MRSDATTDGADRAVFAGLRGAHEIHCEDAACAALRSLNPRCRRGARHSHARFGWGRDEAQRTPGSHQFILNDAMIQQGLSRLILLRWLLVVCQNNKETHGSSNHFGDLVFLKLRDVARHFMIATIEFWLISCNPMKLLVHELGKLVVWPCEDPLKLLAASYHLLCNSLEIGRHRII